MAWLFKAFGTSEFAMPVGAIVVQAKSAPGGIRALSPSCGFFRFKRSSANREVDFRGSTFSSFGVMINRINI